MSMEMENNRRITEQELRQLQARCGEMLSLRLHPTVADRMKRAVKTALGRAGANEQDPLFWPVGLLLMGLVESGRALRDAEVLRQVYAYLQDWLRRDGTVQNTDDALAGVAALRLHTACAGHETLRDLPGELPQEIASRIYAFLKEAPRDTEGSLYYHPTPSNSFVFADGAGMTALFLTEYARFIDTVTGDGQTAGQADALARTQLINYRRNGMDTRSGLPYHGYRLLPVTSGEPSPAAGSMHCENGVDTRSGLPSDGDASYTAVSGTPSSDRTPLTDSSGRRITEKQGLIGWGRAVGFLAMGGLPGLIETALQYQRPDGFFSWYLPALEGHIDTSATAMLGIAMAAAPDCAAYESALARMEAALLTRLDNGRILDSLAECIDFAEHPQRYGVNLWGMGSALLFLSQRYCGRIN